MAKALAGGNTDPPSEVLISLLFFECFSHAGPIEGEVDLVELTPSQIAYSTHRTSR